MSMPEPELFDQDGKELSMSEAVELVKKMDKPVVGDISEEDLRIMEDRVYRGAKRSGTEVAVGYWAENNDEHDFLHAHLLSIIKEAKG